ncbi:MAG: T9SS type A sorting domain-containing protein [Bacteroidales bacterium]|nr:T9SS type A sorting domain-containing protein [Bacteroidales bacterium]
MRKFVLLIIAFMLLGITLKAQKNIYLENVSNCDKFIINTSQFKPMPLPVWSEPKNIINSENHIIKYEVKTKKDTIYNINKYDLKDFDVSPCNIGSANLEYFKNVSNLKNFTDLTIVNDPSLYPYCLTVKMYMTFPNGAQYVGSGTLIHSKFVITAGHCVYSHSDGGWATSITVIPGYNNGNIPYGVSNSTYLYSWTGWTQSGGTGWEWDMAYIQLDRNIGGVTGWTGFGYNDNNSFFTSNTFNNPGYPAASPYNGEYMYYWYGYYDNVYDHILYFNKQSYGGQSGSGAIDNNLITYAELSHGNETQTGCVRINSEKYNDILNNINSTIPSSIDLMPLNIHVQNNVEAGETLSFFTFLIHNYSQATFNDNLNYDVFLYSENMDYIFLGNFDYNLYVTSLQTAMLSANPIIPSETPTGNYSIGVTINFFDANISNNTTYFWDNAPITITNTTVISDLSETNNLIYPNPANSILYFNNLSNNATISIYDISGKLLINSKVANNQVNINKLANGIYIVKINDSYIIRTTKFVKQ